MTKKYRIDGLWIAGIVFGLVIPLPFTLMYSVLAGAYLVPALFAAESTFPERLMAAGLTLWTLAGWAGLASIFSILKKNDYSSRSLNLWQISGFVVGIIAASPWIFVGVELVMQNGILDLFNLFVLCLAGPIIVAVVCLVRLKWRIRKSRAETN